MYMHCINPIEDNNLAQFIPAQIMIVLDENKLD